MATSNAPILVVAALSRELAGLKDEAHRDLALLETGEGIVNAERRLEEWLKGRQARAVLSIGFAGALSASLEAGDVVVACEVRDSTATPDASLLAAAERTNIDGRRPLFGVALTSNEILWKAESKRALAGSLGPNEIGFVDMESTAIAKVCARHGVPFLIARSITDLLDEDLPLNFNQYRTLDGRINSRSVIHAALLKPRALSGLLELRNRSKLCSDRMAEFVRRLLPLME